MSFLIEDGLSEIINQINITSKISYLNIDESFKDLKRIIQKYFKDTNYEKNINRANDIINPEIITPENEKKILDEIKHHYGLVKLKKGFLNKREETTDEFIKRVNLTITQKRTPNNNIFYVLMEQKGYLNDCAQEVQEITNKYLGIKTEPLDAFKSKFGKEKFQGATLEEDDGSALMITNDMVNNDYEIEKSFVSDIANLLNEKPNDYTIKDKSGNSVFEIAGFKNDSEIDKIFCKLYEELINNEEFVKLHEGIHVNHLNNREGFRRRKQNNFRPLLKRIPQLIPILGVFFKADDIRMSIETESLAYKFGLDAYVMNLINKTFEDVPKTDIVNENINSIKDEFKKRNSAFSIAMINKMYVEKKMGNPTTNYGKGLLKTMYAPMLLTIDHFIPQGIGYLMMISATHSFMKSGLSIYYKNKTKKCIKIVGDFINKYKSTNEAFPEVLGKSFHELKKETNNKLNYIK